MKKFGVILILTGVAIIGWTMYQQIANQDETAVPETIEERMMKEEPSEDDGMREFDAKIILEMTEKTFTHHGQLFDVTGSEIIHSIETRGAASGEARASFEEGSYALVASFKDLPEPNRRYFYEGWIVRRGGDLDVISTGKATLEESGFVNIYRSSEDLTDHDLYVLTLEPRDGDPAPDRHILEGTLERIP